VGVDGSPQSGKALEWAVARARLGGEQLELVNAYSLTPALDLYGHGLTAGQPADWLIEFSEQLVDAAAARVRELAPDLTCTPTSTMGQPAFMLAAASEGADAVVVGRRGLGGAASVLLGSVSNRLTIQAKCPLVVVGEGELPTTGPIVVGVDGSEFGTNALRYAIGEAAVRGTSVRAVAAYDVLRPPSSSLTRSSSRGCGRASRLKWSTPSAGRSTRRGGPGPRQRVWSTSQWRVAPPKRSWATPTMRS